MIVCGYVMHLYCDGTLCTAERQHLATNNIGVPTPVAEYGGETKREAVKAARADGWKIDLFEDKAWCRRCQKEAT